MTIETIISGFGGQGVMSLGELLTYGGMHEGREVSWLPSYGPEMRGGSASCQVIVSDEPVGSPIISEADAVLALNLPSLDKFEDSAKAGGLILVNSSLIDRKLAPSDVKAYYIPANEIAIEIGNVRTAGMVMLGALLALTGMVETSTIETVFTNVFGAKAEKLLPVNMKALQAGMAAVQ